MWSFLPAGLLPVPALLAALPPDLRTAPVDVIARLGSSMGHSLVSNLLVVVAIMGALGVTTAHKTGALPRALVFEAWPLVLGTRALSTTAAASVVGAVSVLAMDVTFRAGSGEAIFSLATAMSTVAVTGAAGLWGFLLGVLIRNPLLVLFVVPATLLPGQVMADVAPDVAHLLPSGAQIALSGLAPTELDAGAVVGALAGWTLALGLTACLVSSRRDGA